MRHVRRSDGDNWLVSHLPRLRHEHRLFLTKMDTRPVSLKEHVQRHRARVIELLAQEAPRNQRFFGSVARGDEDGGSDVDVLVDFTSDHSPPKS